MTYENDILTAYQTVGYDEYSRTSTSTEKVIQNGETYYYYYSGGKLISMVWNNGENSLNFLYDGSGNPYSFVYRFEEDGEPFSSSYYYVTNLQGDVVAILNATHGVVAEYTYDAWGNNNEKKNCSNYFYNNFSFSSIVRCQHLI